MAFGIMLNTMTIFFLILATGFVAGKLGVIGRDYLPSFAKLITKILLPVMLFYSTGTGSTRQTVIDNLPMIGLAAAFYAIVIAVTFALSKALRLPHDKDRVFMFSFIFGNTGFVGFPLLAALFPETGILHMALFSIVDQLLFWTFGIWLATARDREETAFRAKSLLTPNIVAMLLALAFVMLEIPLPSVVGDTLRTITNATSAMCMMYLGALLCFSNWTDVLKRRELYVGVAVKMVALPIVCGSALMLTGLPYPMVASLTMIMALPTMTVVPMIASQHGNEGDYAAGLTAATLALCLVTIPLVSFVVL